MAEIGLDPVLYVGHMLLSIREGNPSNITETGASVVGGESMKRVN